MSEAVTLATAADGFEVRRLSPHIGAEIHGVDLTQDLSEDVIAALRSALLEHKVIFFRDQDLTRPQHLDSRGALVRSRFIRRRPPIRKIRKCSASRTGEEPWLGKQLALGRYLAAGTLAGFDPARDRGSRVWRGYALLVHVRRLRGAFTWHAGVGVHARSRA